jgi:hypothetical protein
VGESESDDTDVRGLTGGLISARRRDGHQKLKAASKISPGRLRTLDPHEESEFCDLELFERLMREKHLVASGVILEFVFNFDIGDIGAFGIVGICGAVITVVGITSAPRY